MHRSAFFLREEHVVAVRTILNGRQYIAVAAGGGPFAAIGLSLTPEADSQSGGNAIYIFALPQ